MTSLLDLEEFALSDDVGDNTVLGGDSLFEGEGVEQKLEDLPPTLPDEDEVEELLSNKLMNGFMLIDKPCPKCMIPLVKKPCTQGDVNISTSSISSKSSSGAGEFETRIVTNLSLEQIPKPVKGIPYCVICENYVLTCPAESKWLERLHAMEILGQGAFSGHSIDTRELETLGAKMSTHCPGPEQAVESPSNWMNSPQSTTFMSKGSEQALESPANWSRSPSSIKPDVSYVFKTAFSRAQQKRQELRMTTTTKSSFDSAYCEQQLQGKRLVGKVASQDEGIEMNLEAATECSSRSTPSFTTASFAPSTVHSIPEEREDASISALWKFVGSSHDTAREEECEVSLAENPTYNSDQEPNFGILSNDSVESEHGGDCSATEEDPDNASTLSQHFAAQEAKMTAYDADREEDDSVGSQLEIVSHSIHYIETDKCSAVEKSSDREEEAQSQQPATVIESDETSEAEEEKDSLDTNQMADQSSGSLEVIEAEETQEDKKVPVSKASLHFNISTVDSEAVLEQTLKWEKECIGLDLSSNTELRTDRTLEDTYCSDADKKQDLGLTAAGTEDSTAKLQKQLEDEIKMQTAGDSDSVLKGQPGLSMLEGLGSDDSSTAEISAALDRIEKATLTILEEVQAKKSSEEGENENKSNESESDIPLDICSGFLQQKQTMTSSVDTPMPPSTVEDTVKECGSLSSVTASSKSGSTVDPAVLQEYAVR
jgi:hypothetical protein